MLKKVGIFLAGATLLIGAQAGFAANMIRMQAPIAQNYTWVAATPLTTAWVGTADVTGCSNWSPDPATVDANQSFTQVATDCSQPQQQTVQNRQVNSKTDELRNVGSPVVVSAINTVSQSRSAVGTAQRWIPAYDAYGDWINVGDPSTSVNCGWSPAASTVANGTAFTQTSTTCMQTQQRSDQPRQQNSVTQEYRNVGDPTVQTRQVQVTLTRQAVGTKVAQVSGMPAQEGASFTVSSTSIVRYGISTKYVDKTFSPGTYSCSNGTFGDPAPNYVKSCWLP